MGAAILVAVSATCSGKKPMLPAFPVFKSRIAAALGVAPVVFIPTFCAILSPAIKREIVKIHILLK